MAVDIDFSLEREQESLVIDTRTIFQRIRSTMAGETPVAIMLMFAPVTFFAPMMTELFALFGIIFYWYTRHVQ